MLECKQKHKIFVMNLFDIHLSEKIWKISSECVQDDHYLLENLISADENKRRIGFMAFPVSKPPINVVLECKFKININSIKVHSVLNSLKSTRFQVIIEFPEDGKNKTKTIADISLENGHTGFCLKTLQSTQTNIQDESLKLEVIERHLIKYTKNVSKIILVIKDTQMKRTPVLKKIEIFGNFSESNDKNELKEVLGQSSINTNNSQKSSTIESNNEEESKYENSDTFQIPEDFLDAITLEILNLPYILPCGAVVDETTLEKHKRSEESYGRYPSDPFTGVLFNADSRPKFDVSLKMRLDEFKLKHSHEIEIKNSGRSVGRKAKICQASTSLEFSSHISKKIKINRESTSLDDIIQSIYRNKQISSFINPQKQQSKVIVCFKCNSKEDKALYKISSCGHIFCKRCMIQCDSICFACSKIFERKSIVKLNL